MSQIAADNIVHQTFAFSLDDGGMIANSRRLQVIQKLTIPADTRTPLAVTLLTTSQPATRRNIVGSHAARDG